MTAERLEVIIVCVKVMVVREVTVGMLVNCCKFRSTWGSLWGHLPDFCQSSQYHCRPVCIHGGPFAAK